MNNEIIIVDKNNNEKRSTRYSGRPVGDFVELLPTSDSVFCDLRSSVDLHVSLTYSFPHNDPCQITSAIEHIWDHDRGVTPSSCRIIEDVGRVKQNTTFLIEADGAVVPGLCDQNRHKRGDGTGRRYTALHEDQSALRVDLQGSGN